MTFRSAQIATVIDLQSLAITFKGVFFPLLAVAFLCSMAPAVSAQDQMAHYSSSEHGITFNYDSTLERMTVDLPQSVVALRGKEKGFPSFNILVSAETYQPEKISENEYREKILNDYRAVGLTDAKIVRSYSSPIDGTTVYTCELRYQANGQPLLAAVTLLPGGEHKHFILTYIDSGEQFYRGKRTREDIVNSLQRSSNSLTGSSKNGEPEGGSSNYGLALTLFAALGLLAIFLLFKARASSRTP